MLFLAMRIVGDYSDDFVKVCKEIVSKRADLVDCRVFLLQLSFTFEQFFNDNDGDALNC